VPERLRSEGERDLAERLLREPEVRRAIERIEGEAADWGARRALLATAIRLTPEMAPDVHDILDGCRRTLGLDSPVETYVFPGSAFNAAAVRPERGRLFVILSSALLEAFEPDELRFVAGHEFGHHLFDHHRIPLQALLGGSSRLSPGLVLQLFAWQRYAEISADRAGVVCAGGLDPAGRSLFKLASGLRGGRVRIRIDQFLAQVGDLREEASRLERAEEAPRPDWFSTHPFSPLRLQAATLFAKSEVMVAGGLPAGALEAEVHELMTLMRPSYLQERSDMAEAMRRLLFAGGVLIAAASGTVDDKAIAELERLLGPGSVPYEVKPDAIRRDLPKRIEAVNRQVPRLRRGQVVRDLCVIARADGHVRDAELRVMHEIASAIGVDQAVVTQTVASGPACH
jgi:Zn-dependent protease with chaperone function/tellurite resistance protein